MITPLEAGLLGAVEGLTEFLPVSSTGHLILVAQLLRLQGEAVKTFEVVIQAGALGAVLGLYRARVAAMGRGLLGRDAGGYQLLVKLLVSFVPAAVAGAALHRAITRWLFSVWPVVAALVLGGVLMIGVDRWLAPARTRGWPGLAPARTRGWPGGPRRKDLTLESLTIRDALLIGLAQCAALWPGTSRAMATIVAGLLLGLPARAAAEYSFLLALPTLGAATAFELIRGGPALIAEAGVLSMACGFAAAAVVAALAVRGFVRYLTRRGLGPFGWYRVGLGGIIWWIGHS